MKSNWINPSITKNIFALFFLLSFTFVQGQITKKVLFLGNSYTAVNNLPNLVSTIATSLGDALIFNSNTPGGYTLNGHSTNTTSINAINSNNWDYVVLQEQSQIPSFPPAQVQSDCYPYADSLNRMIQENDSCTVTMFYMTWGRKNGDGTNCPFYTPLCTYEGMQARLYQSYLEMANNLDAQVSPVGAVWRNFRINFPSVELYAADESHPSIHGSYLAACTFYASIYHKSPVGANIPAGITAQEGLDIQNTVNTIVFDSLSLWRIDTLGANADFSFNNISGLNFDFTPNYIYGDEYIWDFGDGTLDTTYNSNAASHTFPASGNYSVQLIVNRKCKSDTITLNINATVSDVNEKLENEFKLFPNPANEFLTIDFPLASQILIYDLSGKLILRKELSAGEQIISTSSIENGMYLIRLVSNSSIITKRIEIIK